MELREMKKLESEVKGLQHLMEEVHRNQMALSRILLKGGSFTQLKEPKVPEGADVTPPPPKPLQTPKPEPQERPKEEKKKKTNSSSECDSRRTNEELEGVSEGAPGGEMQVIPRQRECSPSDLSPCSEGSSPDSFFVRNILEEDSRAGVAVVDLFVTVKMAKDNLQFLSKSNSEIFDKINNITNETAAIGEGYRDLLQEMRNLLGRMNESLTQRRKSPSVTQLLVEKNEVKFLEGVQVRPADEAVGQSSTGSRDFKDETPKVKCLAPDSGSRRTSKRRGRGGCIGCFVIMHRAALFRELPGLSEASLASFLTTLLWMQKGRRRICETCEGSSLASLQPDVQPKLSHSAHRMFRDICRVLDEAARVDLGSDRDPTETDESAAPLPGCRGGFSTNVKSAPDSPKETYRLHPTTHSRPNSMGCRRKPLRIGRSGKSLRRDASESESEIEDAPTAKPFTPLGLRTKPSVTCMGDLTRAVPGKKSASTLTTASNGLAFRKLSGGIRSKMKRMRSKKSLKMEEAKLPKGSKKLFVKAERKIKAGPSADDLRALCKIPSVNSGLEDVVPRQTTTPVHAALASDTMGDIPDISDIPNVFDDPAGIDYLSDDSFHNCDSGSLVAGSASGEEDLEEFVEIFSKSSKAAGKASAPKSFFGLLHETTLKTIKALFFEIQKCYPANFVQEILPKKIEAGQKESSDDGSISLGPGENKEKRLVLEGSSTDFVLYIQVELEDGSNAASREVLVHRQLSSLGTQTRSLGFGGSDLPEENRPVPEEVDDGHNDVWEECRPAESEERERITFDESPPPIVRPQEEVEIRNTHPVKGERGSKTMGLAEVLVLKNEKQRADVWFVQSRLQRVYMAMVRKPWGATLEAVAVRPPELEKALKLIHEIENDVVDVKLGDAVSILPLLEWELRKHVQSKIKVAPGQKETGSGIESFFPSVDFWPPTDCSKKMSEDDPSERMQNLLTMLRELESAIKANESGNGGRRCRYDSSKVYELLRALVRSIRGLEDDANMSKLSQTLDIASQLDTAVREYDGFIKNTDSVHPSRGGECNLQRCSEGMEPVPAKQHLKNVRKKVFESVEDEATRVERRVEKSMARLDLLEKENDEAMTFLETFLQKTKRRVSELTNLKRDLKKMSAALRDLHNLIEKNSQKRSNKKERRAIEKEMRNVSQVPEETKNPGPPPQSSVTKETVVRETVSGLLSALDSLKTKAREKKELCREILYPAASEKAREVAGSSQRSSRSSFTAKHADTLTSSMMDFRKIGESSLYLEWSNPEGSLKDSVTGFEIYVNGKLNQKVRNPRRLQAVLYSVDFTGTVHLELYAITENHPKILLITEDRQEN